MNPYYKALALAAIMIAVALLAVFDIIPEQVAQYAPLAVVPFVVRGNRACRPWLGARRA
jgi:hypothetical protein